jgi:cobalamin biosynthesis Mg chelatase CobN
MRRITSHISLIAVLAAVCLCGPGVTCALAATGASSSVNKEALDKAVQEALAKANTSTGAGTQNAPAAGAETPSSSEAFSAPSESSSNLTSSAAGEEESTATTATTASGTSLSSVSTGVVIPVGILCILLLGGIAFFILRDARSIAPAGDSLSSRSTAQEHAARRRKRRAKDKAARQQRKRNR